MTIINEIDLKDFQFWSGAADRVVNLTIDDFDTIEAELEMLYPDGMSDTELNDMFWFDFDTIASFLGYEDEEDFDRKRDPNYVDDEELEDYVVEWFQNFIDDLRKNKKYADLIHLYENLFEGNKYEAEDWAGDAYYHFGDVEYGMTAAEILHGMDDASDLMERLFEDDQGEYETDGLIPSLEDFRDEIINLKKKQHEDI